MSTCMHVSSVVYACKQSCASKRVHVYMWNCPARLAMWCGQA